MESTDEELLAGYVNGDTAALAALVERYRRPLFGFILHMTEGRDDADEIFQEVWLRVIRKAHAYRPRNFRGWLFRIGHNVVIDRARARRKMVSLDQAMNEGSDLTMVETIPAKGDDPALAAQQRELGKSIDGAIQDLPPEQREVFLLRMQGDVPFKDIARAQRVSINTALARMQYAVNRLRKRLHEDYVRWGARA
jgi:RNA polymerase sigma-70 factor, ECF subfamily